LDQPLTLRKVLSAIDKDVDEEKWIEIDLAKQRLYAHEGNRIVYKFPISSGKWGRTPTGDFRIWSKLKYTLMHGGSRSNNTYYHLPNVPFTQYFHSGYGIHGTYWHNNFGHPMSHGCINMYTPNAETLFNWTSPPMPLDKWITYPAKNSPGTRVIIHGKAP
jgi:lipoprotein-anchoring transpeptidase ErfK/SrfK